MVGIGGGVHTPGRALQFSINVKQYLVACGLALVKNDGEVVPNTGRRWSVGRVRRESNVATQGCLNTVAGGIIRKEAETRTGEACNR